MEPRLTPSERGYLFNREGFLVGIKERGSQTLSRTVTALTPRRKH